jgi:hypothetical protein
MDILSDPIAAGAGSSEWLGVGEFATVAVGVGFGVDWCVGDGVDGGLLTGGRFDWSESLLQDVPSAEQV